MTSQLVATLRGARGDTARGGARARPAIIIIIGVPWTRAHGIVSWSGDWGWEPLLRGPNTCRAPDVEGMEVWSAHAPRWRCVTLGGWVMDTPDGASACQLFSARSKNGRRHRRVECPCKL